MALVLVGATVLDGAGAPALAITRATSLGRDARLLAEHRTELAPDAGDLPVTPPAVR